MTSDEEAGADNEIHDGNDEDEADDEDDGHDDEDHGDWHPDTTVFKSPSGHVTLKAQSNRVRTVFDKAIMLADHVFYFDNPYLDYPDKVTAFRRLLIKAARDPSIEDNHLAERWETDRRQVILAKSIVSLSSCFFYTFPNPE